MDRATALSSQRPEPGQGTGFDELLGLEITELAEGLARARLRARPELTDAGGQVHGGVLAALAQSLAARATAVTLGPEGKRVAGLSNQTNFLLPISGGEVRALARRRHRGRTTWVWGVELTDEREQLCALSRVTIAIRD